MKWNHVGAHQDGKASQEVVDEDYAADQVGDLQ